MKTKTRDKTKEKELKRKEGGETWKRFGFRRRNFRLSKKKWDDRDTVGVSSLSLSRNDTTASRSDTPTVIASPLPLYSAHERTNERKKKRRKQTKRTSEQTRVLHSRVIPEVAVPRFTRLTSVWCGRNEENQGGGGTSWDGTESRQDDATREFRRREGWVSSRNENSRHFWFELCVDLYSSFITIKNIPHRRPKWLNQINWDFLIFGKARAT